MLIRKLVKPKSNPGLAGVMAWVMIITGSAGLTIAVNATPETVLVGDSVASVCSVGEGPTQTLGKWINEEDESPESPTTDAVARLVTPLSYVAFGLTSSISGTAVNLSEVPTSKDLERFISYRFTTDVATRTVISKLEYGDSISGSETSFRIQAQLFSAGDTPTAISGAETEVFTPDFLSSEYTAEEFDFPDTLLLRDSSYELRLYIWSDVPEVTTITGFDDFTIYGEACLPGAPTIEDVSVTGSSASVEFTTPTINGGSQIENYEYSIDSGPWVTLDPVSTSSPMAITVSEAEAEAFNVSIRAVTVAGVGTPSEIFSYSAPGEPEPTPSPTETSEPEPSPTPSDPSTPELCEEAATARSAFGEDGSLFLGGSFMELGISKLGNFGTRVEKPEGFFGTVEDTRVGMSVDYDGFGCGENLSIDFFLPGGPEERFAVGFRASESDTPSFIGISDLAGVNGSGFTRDNVRLLSNTSITNLSSGSILKARVLSVLELEDGTPVFEVTQVISFGEQQMYFTNSVSIKNLLSTAVGSARYMRSFDPDNTVYQGGDFDTENTVIAQQPANSYSAVRAQVIEDLYPDEIIYRTYGSRAPILFYSSDPSARASAFGFANSNPYEDIAYDSPRPTGEPWVNDGAITMNLEFGPLNSGQTKTKVFVTSLDLRDFTTLQEELESVSGEAVSAVDQTPAPTIREPRGTELPVVVAPTPSPKPTATRAPAVRPLPIPIPSPTSSSSPIVGPVNLVPVLDSTPGVVFTPSNPLPEFVREILGRPIAYSSAESTGEAILPRLLPLESLAYENGEPVLIELVKTESENGYVLRGDGWEVALEATDSSGQPLLLDDSGNIILNNDRVVQFSGTGFAPGSPVKVWLFSDPTALSDVIADASGNFVGQSQLPEGIPTGEHTIQLNGLTEDGQFRSVALGVVVQPEPELIAPVVPPVGFDLGGLLNWLWLIAGLVLVFFFILWRRRKKDDEDETASAGSPVFASEVFDPARPKYQDPRGMGPATP